MSAPSWIRRIFTRKPCTGRKPSASLRPRLEPLEDRLVPANFILTSLADDGSVGTLRWAIDQANQNGQVNTITIPSSLDTVDFQSGMQEYISNNVIQLNGSPLPTITDPLSIVGQFAFSSSNNLFAVSGEGKSSVFEVGMTGNLTINNLQIENGLTTGDGGGILNEGYLTLDSVTVSNNKAAMGGGILNEGYLTLGNVTVSNNQAATGGGILNEESLTLSNVTVSNNKATNGGGIASILNTSLTITNSIITSNTAQGGNGTNGGNGVSAAGGGLYLLNGSATLSNDTFTGNQAIGGNGGNGTYGGNGVNGDGSFPANGSNGGNGGNGGSGGNALGGGLFVLGSSSLTMSNNTLSGNSALGGNGGIGGIGGYGGNGGNGGTGVFSHPTGLSAGNGGNGGNGGTAGAASGGGLYVGVGTVTLSNDTTSGNNATGGNGGHGGNGGNGGKAVESSDGSYPPNGYGGHGGNGGNGGTGAAGSGGGLSLEANKIATLTNETLSGNNATGGGGGNGGTGGNGLSGALDGSGLAGGGGGAGSGGGLYVAASSVTLTNDTLSKNNATGATGGNGGNAGKGVVYSGSGSESQSVHPGDGGNGGNGDGGGLNIVSGSTSLANTLIAQNAAAPGQGVEAGISSPGGSPGSSGGPDVYGTVASSDHDLIGDGTDSNLSNGSNGDRVGTTASPINPNLGPLQNNGGPTETMALLSGSPAIDKGDNNAHGLPGTDQRGFSRISGSVADIGAFEDEQPLFSSAALPNGLAGSQYNQTMTATATGGAAGPFTFALASGTLPPALMLAGNGTLSGTPTTGGLYSFTVAATDSNSDTGSQTYTLNVVTLTSISVSTSSPTQVFGKSVTLTATVTTSAGNPVPTSNDGKVIFYDDGKMIGSENLTGSATATLTTASLTTGPHAITAAYTGNSNFAGSQFGDVQAVVPVSGLHDPWGVAVDRAGDVFISDVDTGSVVGVTPTGVQGTIASGFAFPSSVVVDTAGDLFIADTDNDQVVEVKPDGTQTTIGTGLSGPSGVAVDSAGDVFVADTGNNQVVEVKPDGTQTTIGAGFYFPEGVAVDNSGDVFVADTGNNRVVEVTPSGTQTTVGSGLLGPFDVAVDKTGDVFIADTYNSRVVEVKAGGTQTTVGSGFSNPTGVAVDSAGDVYISDISNNQVVEVAAGQPVTVTRATPNVVQLSPINIPYGRALANNQISGNVTWNVNGTNVAVPGTFSYTSGAGTIPNAGSGQNVYVTFTPTDSTDYTTVGAIATVNVAQATPTTLSINSANITYGTALANSQLSGTAVWTVNGQTVNVGGTYNYTNAGGTVLGAGNGQSEAVTFTPTDSTDYTTASITVSVNVAPATPTVTSINPVDVVYGTALDNSQLSGTVTWIIAGNQVTVPGSFSYTSAADTVLDAGNDQEVAVTFTPTDSTDYTTVGAIATVNVAQATPTLSNNPVNMTFGTALANSQLSGTAAWTVNGQTVNVGGTYNYTNAGGTVLRAGNGQSEAVTFTPSDSTDYSTASTMVSVNVAPATPTVTSINPVNVIYGTALANSQLSGTVTWNIAGSQVCVPGIFSYTSAAGTILNTGNSQSEAVTFTPSDATDYMTAASTVSINVAPAATTTSTVSLSSATAVYGQLVELTATVGNTQTAATPSGVVNFFNGSTELGAAPVGAGGVATLSVSSLGLGKNAITASFSDPAGNFVGSSSHSAVALTINKASTTTALTTTTTTPVFGRSVTFTAAVAPVAPSVATPTGSVTFQDGTTVLKTVNLSGGSASFTTNLAFGAHSITAIYNATGNFGTSRSAATSVTVSRDATTAVVASSTSDPIYGQAVTLSAAVSAATPGSGKPSGNVRFFDGKTLLGTATLSNGLASIRTTMAVGVSSIIVVYSGDTHFLGTTSPALDLTVNKDAVMTTLTSSKPRSAHGTPVKLTATALPASPGSGVPTGTMSFWDGSTLLRTVNLIDGVARLNFVFATTGLHEITATYNGNANFLSSTSSVLNEMII
jgi:hypothetical protein